MASKAFNQTRDAGSDVEKASNNVHLHNDVVDTFGWERVSVKVKDKHLLESIDGAAYAGQSICRQSKSCLFSIPDGFVVGD